MGSRPADRPPPARSTPFAERSLGPADETPSSRTLRAAVVVLAANLTGCFLFQDGATEKLVWSEKALGGEEIARRTEEVDFLYSTPRTPDKVERSLRIALDSISSSNGYRALWQAARAGTWLAENLPESEKGRRERFARQGISAAREAVRLVPDRAEPYYYLALGLGQLSDVLRSPRFVKEMAVNAEAARKKDERLDRAGPDRLLGLLNLEGEKHRLITGYGDLDQALGHLRRAVELFPDDAENRLSLAKALVADEDYPAARRELEAALSSKPPPDLEAEHAVWCADARKLEEKIRGK